MWRTRFQNCSVKRKKVNIILDIIKEKKYKKKRKKKVPVLFLKEKKEKKTKQKALWFQTYSNTMNWTIYNSWRPCYKLSFIINYSFAPSFQCCGELFPVTKEVPSTIPGNIYCRIKQKIFCHIFINLYLHLIYTMYVKYVVGAINMLYIYIRLKIKPNNVRIRF